MLDIVLNEHTILEIYLSGYSRIIAGRDHIYWIWYFQNSPVNVVEPSRNQRYQFIVFGPTLLRWSTSDEYADYCESLAEKVCRE
jgi:hypothetical protein